MIKALADPALQLDEISVCGDLDAAMLEFGDNYSTTTFMRWPPGRPGSYGIQHLPVFVIKPLLNLMADQESSAA